MGKLKSVPNLENYVGNAFNVKDGNFLSHSVFKQTYDEKKEIDWNGEPRKIPDQINVSVTSRSFEQNSSVLMSNKSDYDRNFTLSLGAEYAGASFSGSVQSSLMYHGNMFVDRNSSYALTQYLQSFLEIEREEINVDSLDPGFVAASKALPVKIDSDKRKEYFNFFDKYGTHYLKRGNVGGIITLETKVTNEFRRSSSDLQITAAIEAGYKGVLRKGSLNVDAAYSSSKFLENNMGEISMSLDVLGGIYSKGESIDDWKMSIYNSPIILLNQPQFPNQKVAELETVSRLVEVVTSNKEVMRNIEELIPLYMVDEELNDGIISQFTQLEIEKAYSTEFGNGFFLANLKKEVNGNRAFVEGMDNKGGNPSSVRALASQHYYEHSDTHLPYASFSMPVPARDSKKIVLTNTAGKPDASFYQVSIGDGYEFEFGEYVAISCDTRYIKDTDGFVVAYVDWGGINGTRGYIEGVQELPEGKVTLAAASQHRYTGSDTIVPCNSFCMPVKENVPFTVVNKPTSGEPKVEAFFVPLKSKVIGLGKCEKRDVNTSFTAHTDGFLLAMIHAEVNGERGEIVLKSDFDENFKNPLMASASVHNYKGSDTIVPYNSAMIPIAKGNVYRAFNCQTSGEPKVELRWFPVVGNK